MTTITLPRSGLPALQFEGRPLYYDFTTGKRGHEITLYREAGGKIVLHVLYFTAWERDREKSTVAVFDSLDWDAIAAWLASYRAGNDVLGFPEGDQFIGKEARVKSLIEADFKQMVSDMFDDMDVRQHLVDVQQA